MSTPTRIRELRESFLWFERWGEIWNTAKPVAMELLRTADGYRNEFDQMLQETVKGPYEGDEVPESRLKATALTPPWPFKRPEYPHWFWIYYLDRAPVNIDGALALRKLAPFRTGFPGTFRSQKKWINVTSDGFLYPHGVGLVLTVRLFFDRGDWPTAGVQTGVAMKHALLACSEDLYEVTWNGAPLAPMKLTPLADLLLDYLRDHVLGPGSLPGVRTKQPFSVAAVIRGDTASTTALPPEKGDIHKMLQGLCSFHKTWEDDKLAAFKDAGLRLRGSAPEGHLLYHTGRGRAAWLPAAFTADGSFNRASGCYQRNTTLLHLQTEALLGVLAAQKDFASKGTAVPGFLKELAGYAADELNALYSAGDGTYRSSSVRVYLDETPSLKKLVNDALAAGGKQQLSYQPWP